MAPDLTDEYVCFACIDWRCSQCVDVMAVVFETELECHCTRPEHSGEPNKKQILDPSTGAVHAPGLVVEKSGEVKRHGTQTS